MFTEFPQAPTWNTQFFDFNTDEDLVAFAVTAISSGTAAVIDTNTTGRNGVCLFANGDTTDDKGAQIQVDAETFQLATGKTLQFLARFYVSAAATMPGLVGFAITDTSLIASAPSDGIYFQKAKGSSSLQFVVRAGSAAIASVPVATMEDNTFVTVAYEIYDVTAGGAAKARAWLNNTLLFSSELASVPTSEALALSAAFQSGTTASQAAGLDLIGGRQTR